MTVNMDEADIDITVDGPPVKRRRLSNPEVQLAAPIATTSLSASVVTNKEVEVGIQTYVDAHAQPFLGILKTRYSDFIVKEILPNGEVVHLKSTKPPRLKQSQETSDVQSQNAVVEPVPTHGHTEPATKRDPVVVDKKVGNGQDEEEDESVSEAQRTQLAEYLNDIAASELLALYEKINIKSRPKASELQSVRTEFTTDRALRSTIHAFIRETFKSKIDSSTDHDGILVLTAKAGGRGNQWNPRQKSHKNRQPARLTWQERGGDYVHFTLYKENKDTMEAISWLTKQLKVNAKNFQFAGTKDRRAITTQKCSAFRVEADRLAAQNRTLRGSTIGDFEYRPQGLELGELMGNEFLITLRDCKVSAQDGIELGMHSIQADVQQRLQNLYENGYINYYGEQRFGTFSVRTDTIGRHILREDFDSACEAIIAFQADALEAAVTSDLETTIGQDDRNRALAIDTWRTKHDLDEALKILPRKFSAEAQIMRHLDRSPNDYYGALSTIQRNLKLMYVHAYQSLVWNLAASERMTKYGSQVVKGDLVLVKEHKDKENAKHDDSIMQDNSVDANGEQIIAAGEEDGITQGEDLFDRARALTEEEAVSGKYTIFDIVLPQPGFDIIYPENEIGKFYEQYMMSVDGGHINPHNMRRKQRDFSLSGSYRKVLARIGASFEVDVHQYEHDSDQFVKTDRDNMEEAARANKNTGESMDAEVKQDNMEITSSSSQHHGSKIAVVLKFQLGSSQYATMALRELSKSGITQYKPDFSGGR